MSDMQAGSGKTATMKKPRRVSAQHVKRFLEETATAQSAFAEAIGIGNSTVSAWLTEDSAPRWTLVAVEGLRRRMNRPETGRQLIITAVDAKNLAAVEAFLTALGCEQLASHEL